MTKLDDMWFHNLWNDSNIFDFPATISQKETDEVIKEAIRRVIPNILDHLADQTRLFYYDAEHKRKITQELIKELGLSN